ncbi:MAG TPA: MmoB/DmpM family protein [Myxococcota bacterium]|nr:MmoB/DmpM family protein [Myxococcota bacterium]
MTVRGRAGPDLVAGAVGLAVIDALREDNPALEVHDWGAYLRVSAPARCVLRRATVERRLGEPFRLPGDLERIMPSCRGRISITEDEAVWAAETQESAP